MSKILLLLLVCMTVYSNDFKYDYSGDLEYSRIFSNESDANELDLVINNDIYYGNNKLVMSPGYFMYDKSSYNNVVSDQVPEIHSIYLNELYYSYNYKNTIMASIGVFPFRKGSFYEHSYNDNRAGIGLYTITDVTLQGAILSYINKNHTLQIGKVGFESLMTSYKDFDESDSDLTYSSYKDSGMYYLSHKVKSDNWYSEFQYLDIYQYVNDYNIINTNNIGIGISYNDAIDSGRTYYGLLSYSKSAIDISSLYGIKNDMTVYDTKGYYYLLGVKQELDNVVMKKDLVLGLEYSYRSEGYHTLLAGMPLSPHSYADVGNFINASLGIRMSKNNLIKLRYYRYDKMGKISDAAFPVLNETTQVEDIRDAIVFQWYYDF